MRRKSVRAEPKRKGQILKNFKQLCTLISLTHARASLSRVAELKQREKKKTMKEAVKAHGVEQVALPAMARQTYFLRFGDGGFESWDAAARLRGGEPDRAPEFRFRR